MTLTGLISHLPLFYYDVNLTDLWEPPSLINPYIPVSLSERNTFDSRNSSCIRNGLCRWTRRDSPLSGAYCRLKFGRTPFV